MRKSLHYLLLQGILGELLSSAYAKEKADNQHCLLKILSCLRFLARQGCGIRGSGDEVDGNFNQLIKLQAQEDPKVYHNFPHAP